MLGVNHIEDCTNMSSKKFCDTIASKSMTLFIDKWKNDINNDRGPSGHGRNKLRTYKQFKNEYVVETYVNCSFLSRKHKTAMSKFRCGVAPIRLETGRYENIPENERKCPICKDFVENEIHVLLHCNFYNSLRIGMLNSARNVCNSFNDLSDQEKLNSILSDERMIKSTAKLCFDILQARNQFLYG